MDSREISAVRRLRRMAERSLAIAWVVRGERARNLYLSMATEYDALPQEFEARARMRALRAAALA